ncbi:uncharacterized protein [Haliotis asinina]|uniref:uncharacterized protein isoform X2 n=1 Tax=Haliotis asinina TaxID=109174 RepID=UPI0035327B0A
MRSTAFWLCVAAIVSVRDATGISRKVSCFKPVPPPRTTATSATSTTTTNQPSLNIDLLSTLPWRNDTVENGTDDMDDWGRPDLETPQAFGPYVYRGPQGVMVSRRGYIEPDEELWDEEPEERAPRNRGNNFGIMGNNFRTEGNNNGWTSNRPGGMGNRGWYREPDEEEEEMEEEEEEYHSGRFRNPWSGNRNWGGPVNAVNARSALGLSRTPSNGWTGNSMWGGHESDRKRRQVAVVSGKVSCDPLHKIRIVKVTVGYSHDGVCDSRRPRCRRDGTLDQQVALCEGAQSCDLSYEQTPFAECPRPINFVTVEYDCLPDDSTFGICDLTITSKNGPVIVTSPGYPGGTSGRVGEFMTCECVLRTEPNSSITISALSTNMAGNETLCTEDMLLVEMKTHPEAKKFKVVGELCGKTRRDAQPLASNVLRMTYLTEIPAVADRTGFRGIFEAHGPNATPAALLMTCRDISSVPAITEQGTQPSNSQSARRPVTTSSPTVKKTTAFIASAGGVGAVMGGAGSDPVNEESAGAIPGGMLSGVVASLVSIIAIMGSVFVYLLYRRSQRKKMKKFSQQRGGRDESWYNDPTYSEAGYSQPDIPAAISQSEKPVQKTTVDSATYTAPQEITLAPSTTTEKAASSAPPPLPSAPPRRNRKRQQPDDIVYDNANTEDDYASLSDVYNNASLQ